MLVTTFSPVPTMILNVIFLKGMKSCKGLEIKTVFFFSMLQAMRDDIESTQFDLEEVHQTGEQLMTLCGEPDKPEVQKNIDDLDSNILSITSDFDKRSRTLEDALERSMNFQDQLMVG